MRGSSEFDRRIAAFEQEVGELQMHIKELEEESAVLRSKLLDAPLKIRKLESQLQEVRHEASRSRTQSERMATLLAQAREQLVTLQQEIDKLSSPPSGYGVFLNAYDDGTADIFTGGRK